MVLWDGGEMNDSFTLCKVLFHNIRNLRTEQIKVEKMHFWCQFTDIGHIHLGLLYMTFPKIQATSKSKYHMQGAITF